MFLTLTVENNRPTIVNSAHIASINQSYRLTPDPTRPGGSIRVPVGCTIELSNGTRVTVSESMDHISDALDSESLAAAAPAPRDLVVTTEPEPDAGSAAATKPRQPARAGK